MIVASPLFVGLETSDDWERLAKSPATAHRCQVVCSRSCWGTFSSAMAKSMVQGGWMCVCFTLWVWECGFSLFIQQDEDITTDESICAACINSGLSQEQADELIGKISQEEVKEELKRVTQEALDLGVGRFVISIVVVIDYKCCCIIYRRLVHHLLWLTWMGKRKGSLAATEWSC